MCGVGDKGDADNRVVSECSGEHDCPPLTSLVPAAALITAAACITYSRAFSDLSDCLLN